ncbi:unnamed protein product [Vicia faba]|uniref:Uncharacterized protein n=1 Tax=Vicia faba TaxID=3906 RepID=A0AAV0YNW7_VICFA|nr:unnamed protein product [Vicia faba]
MQTVSGSSLSEVSGKFENDFFAKLKIEDEVKQEKYEVNEEDDDEEFTFVFADPNGSPISADDVFDKGQIRPIFPIFGQDLHFTDDYDSESGNRSPVRKIFLESPSSSGKATSSSTSAAVEEGTYCEWNPKVAKKSNSTGSSKLWKLRDPKLRSNSDGKDAFVFLNPAKVEKASSGEKNVVVRKVKVAKGKPAPSAHEKHYMMSKARKESDKRKSYLPYRQELFGFFSSTNGLGLSRNVHPY